MKATFPPELEAGRIRAGMLASPVGATNGTFRVQGPTGLLTIVSSAGAGWEHVSVSTPVRTPTWVEMSFVKDLFWDDQECVMQLHPPKSEYVNNHPHCLHMWRPMHRDIPMPPSYMVGIKGMGELTPEQARAILEEVTNGR